MRILFDQATPVPIRPYLKDHSVRTAAQEGWDKLGNGAAGGDWQSAKAGNIRNRQNLMNGPPADE